MNLVLATRDGLHVVERVEGDWHVRHSDLQGHFVTSVTAHGRAILAGTQAGIYHSHDGGHTWAERSRGLGPRHIRWLAYHPAIADVVLAGTEPAAILWSGDGGATWVERPEVAELRDSHRWWLPYSPEAGCVRGFAFHGSRAYAAVEVGGVLRSEDGGETWRLAAGSDGRPRFGRPEGGRVHADVHDVHGHPTSPDLVFAPTGGGFFVSRDGGRSWTSRYAACYVRAVWVNPNDSDHIVLGPAQNSSGRDGRIEESLDGGNSWRRSPVRWPQNMVERFAQMDDILLAVMQEGQLLQVSLSDLTAVQILEALPPVTAVTSLR